MSVVRRGCGLLLALMVGSGAELYSQTAAATSTATDSSSRPLAHVTFSYENQGLQPAKYTFVIDEHGSGQFHSEPGQTPLPTTASYQPLAEPLNRPVQLSHPVAEQIFATAREQKFFVGPCENKKDKVAFQGTKQLSYQGPDGSGSCTYNWSRYASIEKITTLFESIALTLEEGRRLEIEHKHDRLALDAELGFLLDAVKSGRALEVQTIEPVLREIIEDEAVLERARSRARKLLDDGNTNASLR